MNPILEVTNVSKRFVIDHLRGHHIDFRDTISNLLNPRAIKKEDFWALRDINFNIYRGESVAIVGKNGSGKSTLLKILARITPPTKGQIIVRGKLGCLLEVGTGFHPELTGRENVYLNGAILGMKRVEISSKFDAIVDFSQIEKFLDTPLKRYSSGMQLRLAFAVSAFLDPEIMIIDEVLAVGDSEFQKKCLKKMENINQSGRTILFVSHNIASVERICKKAILLENGSIKSQGPVHDIVNTYSSLPLQQQGTIGEYHSDTETELNNGITKIHFLQEGKLSDAFFTGSPIEIKIYFTSLKPIQHLVAGVLFYDNQDTPVASFNNKNYGQDLVSVPVRAGIVTIRILNPPFVPGIYSVSVYLNDSSSSFDIQENVMRLKIETTATSDQEEPLDMRFNKIRIGDVVWETEIEK